MKKRIKRLLLIFCMLKVRKYILPTFQNMIQIVQNKLFFNDSKRRTLALPCTKKLSALLRRIT